MNLTLTWDLLVIVFFAIVVAYSFIVGKDESVKIIISSYIAIVAVQGVGNLLQRLFGQPTFLLDIVGMSMSTHIIATTKVVIFVGLIIFLAIRGGFEMQYTKEVNNMISTALTGAFGFSTAGLLLSTLLTFIAARPLLDMSLASAPPLANLIETSRFVRIMVEHQDIWFALPACLLLLMGFLGAEPDE